MTRSAQVHTDTIGRAVMRLLADEYRLALDVRDLTDEWAEQVLACAFAGTCRGCGRSVDVSGSAEHRLCGGCIQSDCRPAEDESAER